MFTVLSGLFRAFFEVCLLRRGPQDLPASSLLLAVCLAGYALGSVALAAFNLSPPQAILSGGLETLLLCLLSYLLLALRRVPRRWLQTATALAGTGVVLVLFALPLLAWALYLDARQGDVTIPALLYFVVVVWNVMVLGHIFRHALSTGLGVGVAVALVYVALNMALVEQIVPAQPE
jgi:hypothetical protein